MDVSSLFVALAALIVLAVTSMGSGTDGRHVEK
jgi:hypothetical protein